MSYADVRRKLAELRKPAKTKLPPRQGPPESIKEQLRADQGRDRGQKKGRGMTKRTDHFDGMDAARGLRATIRYSDRSAYEPPRLTLRMIYSRCEEVGDCRLWTGAASKGSPRVSHEGKPTGLRRLVYAIHRKIQVSAIPSHLLCVSSCGNDSCVATQHLVIRAKKTHQQILAKRGHYSAPDAIAKRINASRIGANAKLTYELADWARESQQTAADAAFGLMVSKNNVHLIRQGRAWAGSTGFAVRSVFELGSATVVPAMRE